MVDESLEHMQCGLESTASPLVKRFRVGHDKISVSVQPDEECNSHVWTANQVVTSFCFNVILSFLIYK